MHEPTPLKSRAFAPHDIRHEQYYAHVDEKTFVTCKTLLLEHNGKQKLEDYAKNTPLMDEG